MTTKSFRHGTLEGYKQCKPPCNRCQESHRLNEDLPADPVNTNPFPALGNVPDIVSFLAAGRFNEICIDHLIDDTWSATIKANGDKFVGFGPRSDYAMFAAIRRYWTSEPTTGPITMTVDQTTLETSQGHALADDTTRGIESIWHDDETEAEDDSVSST